MTTTIEGFEQNEIQVLQAIGIPSETIDELFNKLTPSERVQYLYELSKHNIPQINNFLRYTIIKLIMFEKEQRLKQ